ncbi:hypothetical protein PTSG_07400 [Salpingoeca rosetta]|uniref:Uncharacterized protein n=1 Tax=Salpingoeca rosetta (strain ATCC 50818 / BSB-021) TaxID=946362 RepID=F2UIL1_SALR5|nr:uncharacterized protein PTSG_07400 [Salpingoeca rosetta]EGD77060.1 hypothetical protein PTSG_07400 [Salpingoeca rosetta]|eukprot:XP_004990900.1 hypothetical protein PTSG_07400 [Salpingoeca rosetta]
MASLGVHEWACVAQQLLDEARRCTSSMDKRNVVRALFNLMLTSRTLYHDLAWALPKWCLDDTRVYKDVSATHWLDTFQAALARALPHAGLRAEGIAQRDEAATTVTTTQCQTCQTNDGDTTSCTCSRTQGDALKRCTSSSVCGRSDRLQAWLQQRFLVHAWLGMTWEATCPFLCGARQRNQFTPRFTRVFASVARIHFRNARELRLWVAGGAAVPSPAGEHATHAAALQSSERTRPWQHTTPGTSLLLLPAWYSLTTDDLVEELGLSQQNPVGAASAHSTLPADTTRNVHVDTATTASSAAPPAATATSDVTPSPDPRTSLVAKRALEVLQRYRAALGENTTATCARLTMRAPDDVPRLSFHDKNLNTLQLTTVGVVEDIHFGGAPINVLEWTVAEAQAWLPSSFRHVQEVTISCFGECMLNDVAALENVPHVYLQHLPRLQDVSPLRGAKKVVLESVGVTDVVALRDVEDITIVNCEHVQMRDVTLNAKRVQLTLLPVQGPIRLPHATDVTVFACNNLQRVAFAEDMHHLSLNRCRRLSFTPSFKHAKHVELGIVFPASMRRDLYERVDHLVLFHEAGILHPAHVDEYNLTVDIRHVSCASVSEPPPACVRQLALNVVGTQPFDVQHLGCVPDLCIRGHHDGTDLQHADALRGQRALHLTRCRLPSGHVLTDHNMLTLQRCEGEAVCVDNIRHSLHVQCSGLRLDRVSNVPSIWLSSMSAVHVNVMQNVHTCHLWLCRVQDFAPFATVQRVLLEECRFDEDDATGTMPDTMACLRINRCTTTTTRASWPDLTLINTPKNHILAALRG